MTNTPVLQFNIFNPMDINVASRLIIMAEDKPEIHWKFDETFRTNAMKEIRTALNRLKKNNLTDL